MSDEIGGPQSPDLVRQSDARAQALQRLEAWFSSTGWQSFPFQREVWNAYLEGRSGLIHSATGTGKTLAAWMGPLAEWLEEGNPAKPPGLRVLWITPLRALAADTAASLIRPLEGLGIPWTVETRTGDTSAATRSRQSKVLPTALVTTPESLTLMLTRDDYPDLLKDLRCIVVDEWHELMSTKRGVQTELALARLRNFSPRVRTWGVSATLGNLEEAMETLLGANTPALDSSAMVQGSFEKEFVIDSVIPPSMERFPWAGHLGTQMVPPVVDIIDEGGTCLVFTNTRSQAEIWYRAILDIKPEWSDVVALHHGSLDRAVRDEVEAGLKAGLLRAVVCTSSLDLGVDFTPVDRVVQVGSPKGVARLLQRAGRSGHRPGLPSRVTCIPTHALELVDISAAREAAKQGRIESREPVERPLDVLVQHLVTLASGIGFEEDQLFNEVRTTTSFRNLSREEWTWALNFVTKGGSSLAAYPEYHRVVEREGRYVVEDQAIARRHKMSVGTIVSDAAVWVQYMSGGKLGTVEESFIARLKPGDRFLFAGKPLEFVRVRDMTAWVRRATSVRGAVPRWMGGRLPLTSELSNAIRQELDLARNGEINSPEMQALAPILDVQQRWSAIPAEDELLIERVKTREGHHIFFYPFEGRLVHEGLAALFAHRIARLQPITFSLAMNDYGFELLSASDADLEGALAADLLSPENLGADIAASLNSVEMGRRQFREIARIAGLVFEGYPGSRKSARQVQGSSGLFYDVFLRYEPDNLLLAQSNREVLERQLEESRMARALHRLCQSKVLIKEPRQPTPLAFPIMVDRLRETVSSESIGDRIEKLTLRLEKEAGKKK